jgi:glycosyltransferase involved in cell wall biosynthesis
LFYFGQSLGKALLTENNDRFKLSYYLKKKSAHLFGALVPLVYLKKLHQLFFLNPQQFKLYHFTDQYCRLKPQLVKGKKILTIHDLNQVYEFKPDDKKLSQYLKKIEDFINACDRIVAISNFVAADVVRYFPQTANKISVIYNGADKLIAIPGHQPAYKPKRKFLFTIGMLSAKKNFHVLPALLADNDMELVIAGIDTAYREKIMQQAIEFGCAERVTITGPVTDADRAWYYQNCEAFVFPSLAEGFGLPVIEAMHFGKPVFLSRYTSLPEVGGDRAYYFDNFDAAHMQHVLKDGLQHYYSNNLSESIKLHAGTFNWEDTARQYLKLYTECLSI